VAELAKGAATERHRRQPSKAGRTKSALQSAQARTRCELTAARRGATKQGRCGGAGLAQPQATGKVPGERRTRGFARLAGGLPGADSSRARRRHPVGETGVGGVLARLAGGSPGD
jgi:hypothetical protein